MPACARLSSPGRVRGASGERPGLPGGAAERRTTDQGWKGSGVTAELDAHRFLFVGGLHRSGTTIVTRCLAQHPQISGFHETGVQEDEGQFLQSVYPIGRVYGGPGIFGFEPEASLTEHSPLVSTENRDRMFASWSHHWDLARPVLMEKSPPNVIRTRFLQALFPRSSFVIVVRHPVAVTFATFTRRPKRTKVQELLRHWVHCHEILERDLPSIERALVVPYEGFVADPDATLRRLYAFLGLEHHPNPLPIRGETNDRYYRMWLERRNRRLAGLPSRRAAAELEPRVRRFGYSLDDLKLTGPGPSLTG